jgi:nucleoside triphosphate diphosphatase
MRDFKEELGGLLLQVVFQARIAEERGHFDFGDVVETIAKKMIRRRPHVFAATGDRSPKEVKILWAAIKAEEKSAINAASRETGDADGEHVETSPGGLLDDVPLALPGLTRAVKLQSKASSVGFDWNESRLVLAKIRDETDEIEAVLDTRESAAIAEEIGDLLFSVANLVRHVETDPEAALRRANAKFERRFRFVEDALAAKGMAPGAAALAEMETLKNTAKQSEKQVTP